MKKSGFTMIELIFVIVILGVLAAVAIPKLNATRDDAEQAKGMTNLATLVGDLTSYYTAQGTFAKKLSTMTNVPLMNDTGFVEKQAKDEAEALTQIFDLDGETITTTDTMKGTTWTYGLYTQCSKTNVTFESGDRPTDNTAVATKCYQDDKKNVESVKTKITALTSDTSTSADFVVKNAPCLKFTINPETGDIAVKYSEKPASGICKKVALASKNIIGFANDTAESGTISLTKGAGIQW